MRRELLASKKKETGLSLDPRTKLALLITIALFVLSGGGGAASKQFAPILAAVPKVFRPMMMVFPVVRDGSRKNRGRDRLSILFYMAAAIYCNYGRSPTCPAFLTFLLLQSAVSLCGLCRGL